MKIQKAIFAICFLITAASTACYAEQQNNFPDEQISVDELHSQLAHKDKLKIFDARGLQSFQSGHIRGAALPLTKNYYEQEELFRQGLVKQLPDADRALAKAMKKLPKNTPIVTYCNDNCGASYVLLIKLKKLGFSDVKAMKPGFQTWSNKGYPTESAK